MANQVIWVHGNSGQIQVIDKGWGNATPKGWGLHLEGKVQDKFDNKTSRLPWVQFHIPTPKGVENLLRINKVMLRFSTDCDTHKMIGRETDLYHTDSGGAIIQQLHVYDGEINIAQWDNLGWQSSDINHFSVESKIFDQAVQVYWGIGVSVRLWFKNQYFIKDESGGAIQFLNKEVATDTKYAWVSSVGCEFFSS